MTEIEKEGKKSPRLTHCYHCGADIAFRDMDITFSSSLDDTCGQLIIVCPCCGDRFSIYDFNFPEGFKNWWA